jgi:hypothetical protein
MLAVGTLSALPRHDERELIRIINIDICSDETS